LTQPPLPSVDDGARRRLVARFGDEIEAWFDELPDVLSVLRERWQIEFVSLIPRGSMSVVIRCRVAGARPAVLKLSPDHARVANEAAALRRWNTVHTPSVIAVDESLGALLIEAIEPGTALIELGVYPELDLVAELLTSLHDHRPADPSYPSVRQRIAHLFDAGTKPYERQPELREVVAPELYARGHRLAVCLAEDAAPTTLLHGDLTPSNILDGGAERRLVAIDPSPCLGDAAFDAVDLLLWQADDVETVVTRAELLGGRVGLDPGRMLDWSTAFAAMVALELAEATDASEQRLQALVDLAAQAPKT
jgi:streptomycin 6-kinase